MLLLIYSEKEVMEVNAEIFVALCVVESVEENQFVGPSWTTGQGNARDPDD